MILKCLGKLRLDLPLDLGSLQYKVPVLKKRYKSEGISKRLCSFIDILFDSDIVLSKVVIHPFITTAGGLGHKESTDDTLDRSSRGEMHTLHKDLPNIDPKLISIRDMMEEKSEFTFGSNNRNSMSEKSSESGYFPPEVKKFLTKGSGLESSSGGVRTDSQRNSLDYHSMHRFSETLNPKLDPSNSFIFIFRKHMDISHYDEMERRHQ